MKVILAADVFPKASLAIGRSSFWCPLCEKTWERGGHKEGFVKASAYRHVYNCWQVGLFLRGYVVGEHHRRGDIAMPIAEAKAKEASGELHRGFLALYRRAVCARRKAGVLERLAPEAKRARPGTEAGK